MSEAAIQEIESNIRQSKKVVEFGDAIERLRTNKDFKKVIIEGYFEKEAIRLVHLKADPNMQGDESQKAIISQMDAVGTLSQYLYTQGALANMARNSIEADEQTRDELVAEGL